MEEQDNGRERLKQISALLKEQTCELETYNEQLVRRMVEKVTVHPGKLEIEFKPGMIVEIKF